MKMFKIAVLIVLLLQQFSTEVQGQESLPCSEYFFYTSKTYGTNETVGDIRIPSPPKNGQYRLRVGLYTHPSIHKKKPAARLKIAQPIENTIREVQQGNPLIYHIFFPANQSIPRFTKITFNDQELCSDQKFATVIEMEQIYPSNEELSLLNDPVQNSSVAGNLLFVSDSKDDIFPSTDNGTLSIQHNNEMDNDECGISSNINNTNTLINNGEEVLPGDWPWATGIFTLTNYKFICGGSVLTTKHVVTAAHCLKLSINSGDTLPANLLVVAFGSFKTSRWLDEETVKRQVDSFGIHPDYTHKLTGDADIAILTLRTPVAFNSFIKPICLWPGSTDLLNIVDKIGYVVGWGEDEFGYRHTENARVVAVPIVNEVTCLRSHQVFRALTSNNTFCAGSRDLRGPCNGDSGSGLVLYDTITKRFQLRGIVSRSLGGHIPSCDLLNYVVYVDVAKYKSWIQNYIANINNNNITNNSNNSIDYSQCGLNDQENIHLYNTANGRKTLPGQWPWLTAIFTVRKEIKFQCGGNLLTTKHVLTAAHCLKTTAIQNNTMPANLLLVALGRFNLHQFHEPGSVNRQVANYTIHHDYKHDIRADSDIAILILKTPVEYSSFIRPICLWSLSINLYEIENRVGYVAGWGRTNINNSFTEKPHMSKMHIVSTENCHWSATPFVRLTSHRTLCAGAGREGGPCNGDSGNGLVLFDSSTGRYQLRGIVSRSLLDEETNTCNFKTYVVFVDVAKYLFWILQQISST